MNARPFDRFVGHADGRAALAQRVPIGVVVKPEHRPSGEAVGQIGQSSWRRTCEVLE
jgi:hypothetical protein